MKTKPAQAAAAGSGSAESQQTPTERHAQGFTVALPLPQGFNPANPAIPTEALVPRTAAAVPTNIAPPTVSSPVPVPVQVAASNHIVAQAPLPTPASISSPNQTVTSQAPIGTVCNTTATISSTSFSTVPPVKSPVPSIVPVVAAPGSIQEVLPTTSSPVANTTGVPTIQSNSPLMEPPVPLPTTPAETIQTNQGKPNQDQNNVSRHLPALKRHTHS